MQVNMETSESEKKICENSNEMLAGRQTALFFNQSVCRSVGLSVNMSYILPVSQSVNQLIVQSLCQSVT